MKANKALEPLNKAMFEALVLPLPNFNELFILETYASRSDLGAILIQSNHPTFYYSKQLCPYMLATSTYVRESCSITFAVKKWMTYLLGGTFIIHIDLRSIRESMTQVIQTPE